MMTVSSSLFFVVAISLVSISKGTDQSPDLDQINTVEPDSMNEIMHVEDDGSKTQMSPTNTQTKFISPNVLAALVQPFQDKLETFLNALNQADHPNRPQFLNPLDIWQKVQESGNRFFAGLHSLGHSQNTDYPVPFRAARSKPVTINN